MKYCTDRLNSGSETGSQRYTEAGKLQDVNMHLLALGHWAVQNSLLHWWTTQGDFWVGDGFYSAWSENTCLAIN